MATFLSLYILHIHNVKILFVMVSFSILSLFFSRESVEVTFQRTLFPTRSFFTTQFLLFFLLSFPNNLTLSSPYSVTKNILHDTHERTFVHTRTYIHTSGTIYLFTTQKRSSVMRDFLLFPLSPNHQHLFRLLLFTFFQLIS